MDPSSTPVVVLHAEQWVVGDKSRLRSLTDSERFRLVNNSCFRIARSPAGHKSPPVKVAGSLDSSLYYALADFFCTIQQPQK
jgi:hypothetical protein